MPYRVEACPGHPGYFTVFHPITQEPVWTLWQDDWMVFEMMYVTALTRHGEDRANDMMFGYLLGMTHASLHAEKYPRCQDLADGRIRMIPPGHPALTTLRLEEARRILKAGDKVDDGTVVLDPGPQPVSVIPLGVTADPSDPAIKTILPNGQQRKYLVLSEEERAKGFVRPVRRSYVHGTCGVTTKMSEALAETYARKPDFYTGTFCVYCGTHFPLQDQDGAAFTWLDDGTPVGS